MLRRGYGVRRAIFLGGEKSGLELFEKLPDREAWLSQQLGIKKFVNDLHGKDLMKAVLAKL